jgi:hypothetical protein
MEPTPVPVKDLVKVPRDFKDVEIRLHDKVIRGIVFHGLPRLVESTATLVEGDKVYLDTSKQPIRFTSRLLVLNA